MSDSPKDTAKFVILYGSIKHPKHSAGADDKGNKWPAHPKADNGHLGASPKADEAHTVDLEPSDAEKMDPGCTKKPWAGHTLKPLELWEMEQKGESAKKAAMKAVEAEAAKKAGGSK